ncbi:unnamed protein product [Amoebophrya sp. A120]|nr:unnamed protein product [Amoebophrya sp. A120]|eukprot:GSA120T00020940001.1
MWYGEGAAASLLPSECRAGSPAGLAGNERTRGEALMRGDRSPVRCIDCNQSYLACVGRLGVWPWAALSCVALLLARPASEPNRK